MSPRSPRHHSAPADDLSDPVKESCSRARIEHLEFGGLECYDADTVSAAGSSLTGVEVGCSVAKVA